MFQTVQTSARLTTSLLAFSLAASTVAIAAEAPKHQLPGAFEAETKGLNMGLDDSSWIKELKVDEETVKGLYATQDWLNENVGHVLSITGNADENQIDLYIDGKAGDIYLQISKEGSTVLDWDGKSLGKEMGFDISLANPPLPFDLPDERHYLSDDAEEDLIHLLYSSNNALVGGLIIFGLGASGPVGLIGGIIFAGAMEGLWIVGTDEDDKEDDNGSGTLTYCEQACQDTSNPQFAGMSYQDCMTCCETGDCPEDNQTAPLDPSDK